ncbi:MAG: monovalent cation/H(+) antiporter subunit G [Chloroflexota bacterium]|nr:monovalent cation/H(+) antiporter subunit G [Chloroflexota bacterium]MDE2684044.1 monovalent cation/H(+) antiporter subunit G [Chloroflexota bacterium]
MAIAGTVLIGMGLFFMAVTAIGLIRLPDFYARTHAVSKTETLGIGLLLGGLVLHEGATLVSLKIVLGLLFIFIANPVAAHVLARSALQVGIMPWTRRDSTGER